MATSARTSRITSRALAVIGVNVLEDARMTWVAAEVESEQALSTWFEGAAPNRAAAYVAYRAAADREEAAARDLQRRGERARALQRLGELIRPYQERLARTQ